MTPALTEIHVVTTATEDLTYDTLALTMRQEQLALGRKVKIAIWDELQSRIRRGTDAYSLSLPVYVVADGTGALRAPAMDMWW